MHTQPKRKKIAWNETANKNVENILQKIRREERSLAVITFAIHGRVPLCACMSFHTILAHGSQYKRWKDGISSIFGFSITIPVINSMPMYTNIVCACVWVAFMSFQRGFCKRAGMLKSPYESICDIFMRQTCCRENKSPYDSAAGPTLKGHEMKTKSNWPVFLSFGRSNSLFARVSV